MSDAIVPSQVISMWSTLAGGSQSLLQTGTRTVVTGSTGLCPRGWTGVLRIGEAVVIERGGADDDVIDALLGLPDPTDRHDVLSVVDAEQTLGPGVLHHSPDREVAATVAARGPDVVVMDGPSALQSWLAGLPAEDIAESSADELDRLFVVEDRGTPLAIAGWMLLAHDTAHFGVLVDPSHRGRGLSSVVGAAATVAALDQGLHPQWRAAETNSPSRRAAATIGYVETGRQFSLRQPRSRV